MISFNLIYIYALTVYIIELTVKIVFNEKFYKLQVPENLTNRELKVF